MFLQLPCAYRFQEKCKTSRYPVVHITFSPAACVAHINGLKPQDTDMSAAISSFRNGGQPEIDLEVPEFIDI
jgi:hypothetical protein